MLYLIQSLVEKEDGDFFKILKIGYTDNLESRMRSYYSCNPGTKLLATREGGIELEGLFHFHFKKYKYEGDGFNEWFYWNEEIMEGFPKLDFLQERYENYLIKNLLIHPEDLFSKHWENLKKDLEDKVKSNPELSEFFDSECLKSIFKDQLVKLHNSLKDYLMGIDYCRTLKENRMNLEFSELNINTLFYGILLQIVGRQRDGSNPFKNDVTLFYKTLRGENLLSRENFQNLQNQRKASTEIILGDFEKLSDLGKLEYIQTLKAGIKVSKYSRNFVSVSKYTNLPVYNTLVEAANEKAWEVSQADYQNKIIPPPKPQTSGNSSVWSE